MYICTILTYISYGCSYFVLTDVCMYMYDLTNRGSLKQKKKKTWERSPCCVTEAYPIWFVASRPSKRSTWTKAGRINIITVMLKGVGKSCNADADFDNTVFIASGN